MWTKTRYLDHTHLSVTTNRITQCPRDSNAWRIFLHMSTRLPRVSTSRSLPNSCTESGGYLRVGLVPQWERRSTYSSPTLLRRRWVQDSVPAYYPFIKIWKGQRTTTLMLLVRIRIWKALRTRTLMNFPNVHCAHASNSGRPPLGTTQGGRQVRTRASSEPVYPPHNICGHNL